jgi:NAD(P)-dependent dehydrogenase (short-subunit alcohol dehydrogenase family)
MSRSLFSLEGKVAVVTGASRGIGQGIAKALADAGARLALIGREATSLAAAAESLGACLGNDRRSEGTQVGEQSRALPIVADVSDRAAIGPAFQQVVEQLGRLDILINNAGVEQVCPSLEVGEALWDRILGTNLKGAFFCAQQAAALMSDGGSIVNICSLTSEVGVPGAAPYGASKSGLAGLTRALATEWAPRGIRVNGIGPGYFRTALTETFYEDAQWQAAMLSKIPMGRFGQLTDLAGAAVFLCSDAASYVTGQVLYVDGGYLAAI